MGRRGSKPGFGSQKGGAFERKMCKTLSLWVSGNTRDDLYWRTALSGGVATIRNRKKGLKIRSQLGDIAAVDPKGARLLRYFFVECKHKKSLEIQSWIFGRTGVLPEIWQKPSEQATDCGKMPLCLVKQNQHPELVLTTKGGYELLRKAARYGDLPVRCIFSYANSWAYVFLLSDLLILGSYERLKPHLKKKSTK